MGSVVFSKGYPLMKAVTKFNLQNIMFTNGQI